jgi:membrane-bound ClpP family serine protease
VKDGEYGRTLFAVRYVLPSLLCIAGLVLIVIEPQGATLHGGLGIIGAGLAGFLFSFFARISMTGDETRVKKEEAARAFFDEYGRWPDEDPSRTRRRG